MGTLSEEIFSRKVGRPVEAGEVVIVPVDMIMSHDTTSPLAIEAFKQLSDKVHDNKRLAIVFDHIVPPATTQSANLQKGIRGFIQQQDIQNFYNAEGICHQLMVEKGLALPGEVVVGADSHTITYGAVGSFATGMGSTDIGVAYATGKSWFRVPETFFFNIEGEFPAGVYAKDLTLKMVGELGVEGALYRAIEFGGPAMRRMSVSERMTLANMSIEMGGKAGLVDPDEITLEFVSKRAQRPFEPVHPKNPRYERVYNFNLNELTPLVACPPDVDNTKTVDEAAGIEVDEVFIGTCTNGRLDDLEIAARILAGKRVNKWTRTIINPASIEVYLEAMRLGYIKTFIQAGCVVENPGCGPCIGRHQGVLAKGERAITTMNRNFTGRMGDPTAEIYLASPATAAASAIEGRIADPRPYLAAAMNV